MEISKISAQAALIGLLIIPVKAVATGAANSGADVPAHLKVVEGIVVHELHSGPTFSFKARPDTNLGWYNSVAINANASNSDNDDYYSGVAARFGHFDGQNSHDLILSYAYDEDAGKTSTNIGSGSYFYRRSFSERSFAYGQFHGNYNELESYEKDAFAVAGLGYRLFNSTRFSLGAMAGPGYRYAKRSDGMEFDEAGFSLSTKGYFALSDSVYTSTANTLFTSGSDTVFVSDLGINFALTDSWGLRTSVLTEYHSDTPAGKANRVNVLRASLTYTFN